MVRHTKKEKKEKEKKEKEKEKRKCSYRYYFISRPFHWFAGPDWSCQSCTIMLVTVPTVSQFTNQNHFVPLDTHPHYPHF